MPGDFIPAGPYVPEGGGALVAADIPNLSASQITSGTMAQARLGTGSGGTGALFLADDQTFKAPPGGGGSSILEVQVFS